MKNPAQLIAHAILKNGLLLTVLLFALIFGMVAPAQADGMVQLDRVQSGAVIENDVFLSGQAPTVDGTVNGDVFAIGTAVAIKGDINGSLFVIGNQVTLDGKVTGSVYSLALSFDQTAASSIERSLYILAVDLSTQKGSTIGRDLWAGALSASLAGETARDTKAVIGLLKIYRILRDGFNRSILGMVPSNLQVDSFAVLPVKTAAHAHAQRALARVDSSADFRGNQKAPQAADTPPSGFLLSLRAFLTLLLVGWLAVWWKPALVQRCVDAARNKPLASLGYGLAVLINGYILAILLLVVVLGLAFGIYYLGLPFLGSIVLGGGLSALGLSFAIFYACVAFFSKVVVAFLVGYLILNMRWSGVLKYKVLPLLLGLIIYGLLGLIPFVGWVTSFVFTLLGLGAIWLAWREKALPEDPLPVVVEIENEVDPIPPSKKAKSK